MRAQTVIDANAIHVSHAHGVTTFEIRAANEARVTAFDRAGHVLHADKRAGGKG